MQEYRNIVILSSMKTTIDIPDDLYRQVKARLAMQRRTVREVTIALYRRWLSEPEGAPQSRPTPEEWLESWLAQADTLMQNAAEGPSARELLAQDRARLDPKS